MGLPAAAGGGAGLVRARSAEAVACLEANAVLLAGVGSAWLPSTVAVLVMVPAVAGAVALIVIVALAPEASEPTAQVAVHEALVQVPWVEVADVKPTPESRVSVTVAPVAASGPLFFAVRV